MNNSSNNSNNNDSSYWVVIPAAGIGSRMQSNIPKQYLPIDDYPVIAHTISQFLQQSNIAGVMVAISETDARSKLLLNAYLCTDSNKPLKFCIGGKTREESVLSGLKAIADVVQSNQWVLVHDAARPGISQQTLENFLLNLQSKSEIDGYVLAKPATDTVKLSTVSNVIKTSLDRTEVWTAQTPQAFNYKQLQQCLHSNQMLNNESINFTDESSAMEQNGAKVKLIEGNSGNFKITTADDVARMEFEIMHQLKNSERVHPKQFFNPITELEAVI